jgi:hypothetical protein
MKRSIHMLLAGIAILSSACGHKTNSADLINKKASLPPSFQFEALGLKVMSSSINKKRGTMSTLYANELGLKNAIAGLKNHMAGEVFALVTWKQQEDDHWFGAKIPGDLSSVELVKTTAIVNHTVISYKKFEGKDLVANPDTLHQQDRIKYIFEQQPSVMP